MNYNFVSVLKKYLTKITSLRTSDNFYLICKKGILLNVTN